MKQTSNATIGWHVRRTVVAQYLPATLLVAAVGTWAMLEPTYGIMFALICTIGAICFEHGARRQLALAKTGRLAVAIVGEVHRQGLRYDNPYVDFHFTTNTGAMINGRCPTNEIDRMIMTTGARIEVLYDPNDPQQHIVLDKLWAVCWERAAEPVSTVA